MSKRICLDISSNESYKPQWTALPPEIWIMIMKYLPLETLCKLNTTCTTLRMLVYEECRQREALAERRKEALDERRKKASEILQDDALYSRMKALVSILALNNDAIMV